MATRFYLPANTAPTPPITVTPSASWDVTTAFDSRPTTTFYTGTAITAGSRAKGSAVANTNRLDVQFIGSQKLDAQTIAVGTFSAVMRTVESAATTNAWLQVIIRVVDATGGTVRGTIFAGQTQTTTPSATVGAVNEEFGTTSATRILNAVATTAVTTQAGDLIVIETGARIGGTTSADTTTLRYGDDSTKSDFALTSGLTSDLNPWVELSANLVFLPVAAKPIGRDVARRRASLW
jgi:hypothetical protein